MKTLIVYTTKYGCTEKCANMLSQKLTGTVELCHLKGGKAPDLSQYDKVIVGGSIYIGSIQKEAKEFCTANINQLKEKKVGLFACSMREGDMAKDQIKAAFPQGLLDEAIAIENFGGEFAFSKMSFLDKFITKKVVKVNKDTSTISEESISKFAQLMNNA